MKHNVAGPIADLAGAADELLPPRAARALFWRPRLLQNAAWTIHVPFAFWLVETCRPRRIVELGLGKGVSYFAFCQAVDKLGIEARCTGIDHWEGDRFTRPDPDAGATPRRHNEQLYQEFSDLVSADLIGAEARFPDETVDLLHVDVALTPPVIDSLLHDWPRKLSHRAVVALHGTRTRCETPEAADFLARIRARHRTFEIEDGEGLTLALIGTEQPERLARLAALEPGSAGGRRGAADLPPARPRPRVRGGEPPRRRKDRGAARRSRPRRGRAGGAPRRARHPPRRADAADPQRRRGPGPAVRRGRRPRRARDRPRRGPGRSRRRARRDRPAGRRREGPRPRRRRRGAGAGGARRGARRRTGRRAARRRAGGGSRARRPRRRPRRDRPAGRRAAAPGPKPSAPCSRPGCARRARP